MSLDDTLAAWAATIRLPAITADHIYQQILMTPPASPAITPGLDPAWWKRFTADFTARIITSTQARPSAA